MKIRTVSLNLVNHKVKIHLQGCRSEIEKLLVYNFFVVKIYFRDYFSFKADLGDKGAIYFDTR